MNARQDANGARDDATSDEPMIVAIVPAPPGWWTVWRDDSGEVLEPVPMFALVETTWPEFDPDRPRGPVRTHRARWVQAMTHDGNAGCALGLAERSDGYCGLRYFAPGTGPTSWASDGAA